MSYVQQPEDDMEEDAGAGLGVAEDQKTLSIKEDTAVVTDSITVQTDVKTDSAAVATPQEVDAPETSQMRELKEQAERAEYSAMIHLVARQPPTLEEVRQGLREKMRQQREPGEPSEQQVI